MYISNAAFHVLSELVLPSKKSTEELRLTTPNGQVFKGTNSLEGEELNETVFQSNLNNDGFPMYKQQPVDGLPTTPYYFSPAAFERFQQENEETPPAKTTDPKSSPEKTTGEPSAEGEGEDDSLPGG